MAFQLHPEIPFIEVGTTLDYNDRHMIDGGSENEWLFEIAGVGIGIICQSAEDALKKAEEALFLCDAATVTWKESEALEAGDIRLAIFLAERRGYWAGKTEVRRQVRDLLLASGLDLMVLSPDEWIQHHKGQ